MRLSFSNTLQHPKLNRNYIFCKKTAELLLSSHLNFDARREAGLTCCALPFREHRKAGVFEEMIVSNEPMLGEGCRDDS